MNTSKEFRHEQLEAFDQTNFTSMLKGIPAFIIEAETIESKLKINQNT